MNITKTIIDLHDLLIPDFHTTHPEAWKRAAIRNADIIVGMVLANQLTAKEVKKLIKEMKEENAKD